MFELVNTSENKLANKLSKSDSLFTLSKIKNDQLVKLVDVVAGENITLQLAELGLIGPVMIKMNRNVGSGPIIITVRDTQLMIGRNLASKLLVELIE